MTGAGRASPSQGMVAGKLARVSNSRAMVGLVGLTIVYQVLYQGAMWYYMRSSEAAEAEADCSSRWGGAAMRTSPQCLELELFRKWSQADLEEQGHDLVLQSLPMHEVAAPQWGRSMRPNVGPSATGGAYERPWPTPSPTQDEFRKSAASPRQAELEDLTSVIPARAESTRPYFDWLFSKTMASLANRSSTTAWAEELVSLQKRLQERMDNLPSSRHTHAIERQAEFDRLYNETWALLQNRSSVTPWAQELMATQKRLQERMEGLPSFRHQRAMERQAEFDRLYNETWALLQNRSSLTPWAQELMATQKRLQERMDSLPSFRHERAMERQAEFNRLYHETRALLENRSTMTPLSRDLVALQARLQDQIDRLPSTRRARAQERQRQFEKLLNETSALLETGGRESSWARDVRALQEHLQAEKDGLPSAVLDRQAQFDRLYSDTLAVLQNKSSLTPWATELMTLQQRLESRRSGLSGLRRASSTPSASAVHDAPSARSAQQAGTPQTMDSNSSVLEQVFSLGRELCEEPHRRGYAACAPFLGLASNASAVNSSVQADAPAQLSSEHTRRTQSGADEASRRVALFDSKLDEIAANRRNWEKQFASGVAEFARTLCMEGERQNYPACAQFLGGGAADGSKAKEATTGLDAKAAAGRVSTSDAAPRSSLRGATGHSGQPLLWSAVQGWAGAATRGSHRSLVEVAPAQLKGLTWQGRLPRVACIAAVLPGGNLEERLHRFLGNFRRQDYEGPRQLVLVYQHSDVEVARLVQEHADGTYIRSVAARGGGQFPSTTALRYGAWRTSSDVDVIASWHFDEWHHPSRMAMQVRALAVTSRPASLLKRWTVSGAMREATLSGSPGWEGSLVGEASWMRKYWMPSLGDERATLADAHSHWIVQVDMPELLVYIVSAPESWADTLRRFRLQVPTDEFGAACAMEATGADGSETPLAGAEVEDVLGAELQDVYHGLEAKRHTIADGLWALCAEAVQERDPAHRDLLRRQAVRMAAIQRWVNDHFDAVKSLIRNRDAEPVVHNDTHS